MTSSCLIGIAGPSGSGKTTIARALQADFGDHESALLSLDSYYHDLSHLPPAEREAVCFDAPEALDFSLLTNHIGLLRRGQSVLVPVYDFSQHCRAKMTRQLGPGRFLIVEGILALHSPALRDVFQLSIYVHTSKATCLSRRVTRDVAERGRTVAAVRKQFETTVWPMAEKYVLPSREFADLVVDGEAALTNARRAILTAATHAGLWPATP